MKTNPIDDLHASVNDIYEQYDMGKIDIDEAVNILRLVTQYFLESTK